MTSQPTAPPEPDSWRAETLLEPPAAPTVKLSSNPPYQEQHIPKTTLLPDESQPGKRGGRIRGIASDFVTLRDVLTPHMRTLGRTLLGKFSIRPPYVIRRAWLRNIMNVFSVVIGFITGSIFYFATEWHMGSTAIFVGISMGISVMLFARRPVQAWQLSLAALIFVAVGSVWESEPFYAIALYVLLISIRLVMLTERPLRWIVPLLSSGIVSFCSLLFFDRAFWLVSVPIIAIITFIIDNNRIQHQARASRDAAQQAAAVAGRIAADAQTEVLELGNREAVLRERTRIARDLHDVVAHHMSMVVVRAQTAQYRLDDVPEEITSELDEIANLARQSLTEVRELLTVLRSDHDIFLAPQPTLDELPELIEQAQTSGMAVSFESSQVPQELSVSASIAAYRVIQEGLANVRRHAPEAHADVLLVAQGNHLLISIHNEAPPQGSEAEAQADTSVDPRADTHSDTDSEIDSETDSQTHKETRTAAGIETGGESMLNNEAGLRVETMADSESDTNETDDHCVSQYLNDLAPGFVSDVKPGKIGHGLLGVQERVHAVGGMMSAAPTSDGGFLLYVRIPISRQEPDT